MTCCALVLWLLWAHAGIRAAAAAAAPGAAGSAERPNVLLIQADDMTLSELDATFRARGRSHPAMPKTIARLSDRGVRFDRYYSSDPICGPSRASLLTGRATHDHGMLINGSPYGYPFWRSSRFFGDDLPVWLRRSGYRTVHVGKYLNGYGYDDPTEVPPGWSRWLTPVQSVGAAYYGYNLNLDGAVGPTIGSWREPDPRHCRIAAPPAPGTCLHATDMQTALATDEIESAARARGPFYIEVDYDAPHDDGHGDAGPTPPSRYLGLARKVRRAAESDPPFPAYDERAVGDKPSFVRSLAPLSPEMRKEIATRWGNEVASVRGIDDGVGRMIGALRRSGALEDTYVIFTSDNGLFHGEHRLAYGKFLPYEPATHLPMLIRGPGIPAGRRTRAPASNLGLASTVLAMTGATGHGRRDGASLLPYARHPGKRTKVPVLLEGFNSHPNGPERFLDGQGGHAPNWAPVLNYTGLVAGRWKFIRYDYGAQELYDLHRDPAERDNLVRRPGMRRVKAWARSQVGRLSGCAGRSCKKPVEPPRRRRRSGAILRR